MRRKSSRKQKSKIRRNLSTPSKDKGFVSLSSVHIDPEKKKVVLFSEDILLNQLRQYGPKIETSFDHLCENDLIQLSSFFSETVSLLYSGLTIAKCEQDELRIACGQLLMNATNSYSSAVAVLRMGYVSQPGIIIRSLLEAVSTSLHLLQNPSDLTAYKDPKFKSTETVKAAKKALPPFGRLYGYFSTNFTHISHLHKSITPISEHTERNEALEVNLSFLRIAAWFMYVTVEWLFWI